MRKIGAGDKVAILIHGQLNTGFGKLGQGMLRYSNSEIVAVVDEENIGGSIEQMTGICRSAPIVASVAKARELGAEVLVIGVAPPGGMLPDGWREQIIEGLRLGMSVVNPLHGRWETDAELRPYLSAGNWIWDVRVEPPGLVPASGLASRLTQPRILTVGTDMSVGKMTAALELTAAAKEHGINAHFVATGQVGICIAGSGVPLDAVRLDFAAGAIESETLSAADAGAQMIIVEGQGALCHPASTATLALMRGCMPTHLLFVHRARQERLRRMSDFVIPSLPDLIRLNEEVAACEGAFPRAKTIGVVLNCAELSRQEARREITSVREETGLPVADPIMFGREALSEMLERCQ